MYFFAGPVDTQALVNFFVSREMRVVPCVFDDASDALKDNLVERPGCCVSPIPYAQLRRSEMQLNPEMHANHRNAIEHHSQPVISWRRSHVDGDYLIAGDLEWVDWTEGRVHPKDEDLRRLNAVAGKVFRAARRWIHKNWTNNGAAFWHGPEALALKRSGLRTASWHPDRVKFTTVFVDRASGTQTEVEASSFDEWAAMTDRSKPN